MNGSRTIPEEIDKLFKGEGRNRRAEESQNEMGAPMERKVQRRGKTVCEKIWFAE